MDLADRRRGERRRIEIDEQFLEWLRQIRIRMVSRTVASSSAGTLVCSFCNSSANGHADLIGPSAQNLAELDERRPELFDRHADSRLAAEMARVLLRRGS